MLTTSKQKMSSKTILQNLPPKLHSHKVHLLRVLQQKCSTFLHLKQVQTQMLISGVFSDTYAANCLISFCLSMISPNLSYSSLILSQLHNPNVFSYNLLIRGYADSTNPLESVKLYRNAHSSNVCPDKYTFTFLLKACAKSSDFVNGFVVFCKALRVGMVSDVFVFNALVHLFAIYGEVRLARKLFDESSVRDVVSWNTVINAYVQHGQANNALNLFKNMIENEHDIRPDEVTMIGVVSCCTQLQDLQSGKRYHRFIEENHIKLTAPLTNALMDMYIKCGSLEQARALFDTMSRKTVVSWTTMIMGFAKFGQLTDARRIFDEMPHRDIVPWNALMAGYVNNKRSKDALSLFQEMQVSNVKPNELTMITLLSACSELGSLETGMWVHRYIEKEGFVLDVALGTALVDMYAKCGKIDESLRVFKDMKERNKLTWTSIICGLASHGHGLDAIHHFTNMIGSGLDPDDVTFLGVLLACLHAGLVNEGHMFFSLMRTKYGIRPQQKHYSCMVSILGRAGLLREAEELIGGMPMKPDPVVWGALFFACRIHNNVDMGKRAAMKLIELDPMDSATYVLLANMYKEANMRNEADKVMVKMREEGVEKTPGCSSIEVNGVVYEFMVKDSLHPDRREIYECIEHLCGQFEQNQVGACLLLDGYATPNGSEIKYNEGLKDSFI